MDGGGSEEGGGRGEGVGGEEEGVASEVEGDGEGFGRFDEDVMIPMVKK